MASDFKPRLAPVETIPLGSRHLLIRPQTGAWLIAHEDGLDLARSLTGKKSVQQLIQEYGDRVQHSEIGGFVRALFRQGLLESSSPPHHNAPICRAQPTLAVLNLTRRCNLGCRYCYAGAGKSGDDMSSETALTILDQMLELHKGDGEKPTILFHGGEPLLNFGIIEDVIRYADHLPAGSVRFEVQTNLTLLSRERAEFMKAHDIGVGISIDGPQHLHDATRSFQNGAGSYDSVVKGIALLREKKIGFGAIVVLTSMNWAHMKDCFNLLVQLGIRNFSLNPFFEAGAGKLNRNLAPDGVQIFRAYQSLLHELIEYNRRCATPNEQVEERNLKYLVRNIVLRDRSYMCMRNPCGAGLNTLAFDTNGDVYPCDDFIMESDFKLGNVHEKNLSTMITNAHLHPSLARSVDNIPLCSRCVWRQVCNGLCPGHAYFEQKGEFEMPSECRFRQLIIPYLLTLIAEGSLEPRLLDRQWPSRPAKHLYFNINYTCNNRCVFCESEKTSQGNNEEIDAATFKALLDLHRVSPNDSVTINGGEPTLTRHLTNVLVDVARRGAYCHLFTNGRALSSEDYCRELLLTGVRKISIPLYALDAEEHDALTCSRGSFQQTVAGIRNVLKLRKTLNRPVTLELKLLFFRPTIDRNPRILEWIAEEFPDADQVSLNSLIVSRPVLSRQVELVPSPKELVHSVNSTLDIARAIGIESRIILNDIPYCIIEERNSGFLPPAQGLLRHNDDTYFDGSSIGGSRRSDERTFILESCNSCPYLDYCAFINRLYIDDFIAIQNLCALFPDAKIVRKRKSANSELPVITQRRA